MHYIIFLFNCAGKSVTSVQNRLIRAREKMIAKSKDNYDLNDSKNAIIKKLPTCECKQP